MAFAIGLGAIPSSNAAILVLCVGWTVLVVTAIWAIGLVQGNHSLADAWYGFGFATAAWIAYALAAPASPTAALLVAMVSLHGCRLGFYLTKRWLGYRRTTGGDQRYLDLRKRYAKGYWWKSLLIVVEPQALVIAVVGLPAVWGIAANRAAAGPLGPLSWLGLLVFGIGFYFEVVGDGQLQAFKADPANKGRYLRTGVWTHTRHPNYFGNATVWWGIGIVAVAGDPAIWWTLIGPLVDTIMLTGVVGKAYQDKHMGVRPEYRALMAETRGFLPIPVSRK